MGLKIFENSWGLLVWGMKDSGEYEKYFLGMDHIYVKQNVRCYLARLCSFYLKNAKNFITVAIKDILMVPYGAKTNQEYLYKIENFVGHRYVT